jgi:two-component system, OmpR family, response regulator
VRSVLRAALEGAGATVKACVSGDEALTAVIAFRPTLILLDFVMCDMDGRATWEALRICLTEASLALPPAVFLSARTNIADDVAALGAVGILAKPFNPATLVDELCRLLGSAPQAPNPTTNRLAGVAAEFHGSLPSTAEAIESLWREIRGQVWNRETATALLAKAHNLAGTAGLFDRKTLGAAAEDVERLLLTALKLECAPEGQEMQKLGIAVAALIAGCGQ